MFLWNFSFPRMTWKSQSIPLFSTCFFHMFCYALVALNSLSWMSIFLLPRHHERFHDPPKSEFRLSAILWIFLSLFLKHPKTCFLRACFLYISISLVLTNFCFLAVHVGSCYPPNDIQNLLIVTWLNSFSQAKSSKEILENQDEDHLIEKK